MVPVYTKTMVAIASIIIVLNVPGALAADAGFGVRFANKAPAALEEPVVEDAAVVAEDISAEGLNQIAPAAGDAAQQKDVPALVKPKELIPAPKEAAE